MADINEEEEEDFSELDAEWEDADRIYRNPASDYERMELLRIALNFPKSPGSAHILECCTPTDLDELESILKRHLRK